MSDQEAKLEQLIAITGAAQDRARFFLESSAWDVEVAFARYYENDADDVEEVEDSSIPQPETPSPVVTPIKPKPKKASNFGTINTLATSSSDEEEGQAYYAGGSENSGQQVLGPPKKKDFVADMFKSVQESGVETFEPGSSSSTSTRFKGTGYKLGQDESASEAVPGFQEPPLPREVVLKLWQNGFSVDDGELREYTNPENAAFLSSIKRGMIPSELRQGNNEIQLAMEDHRAEKYKPPKVRSKPFQGHGYTLGSPAPAVVGATSVEHKPANEAKAKEMLKLNTAEPTTSLQIRLADGTRLVGQFNHSHTVGQVRQYINVARPQYETQSFNLMSTYPSKVLDDAQSLKEAGLLNAAIMQKLT